MMLIFGIGLGLPAGVLIGLYIADQLDRLDSVLNQNGEWS